MGPLVTVSRTARLIRALGDVGCVPPRQGGRSKVERAARRAGGLDNGEGNRVAGDRRERNDRDVIGRGAEGQTAARNVGRAAAGHHTEGRAAESQAVQCRWLAQGRHVEGGIVDRNCCAIGNGARTAQGQRTGADGGVAGVGVDAAQSDRAAAALDQRTGAGNGRSHRDVVRAVE